MSESYKELLEKSWKGRHGGDASSNLEAPPPGVKSASSSEPPPPSRWQKLKRSLFDRVLDDVETTGAAGLDYLASGRERLKMLLEQGLKEDHLDSLTAQEKTRIEEELVSEISGYGPLDPLFRDSSVSDILINGPYEIWVDRFGKMEKTAIRFDDDHHLKRIINRMVSAHGRHLEEASPFVDARLPDGSRLHAMIPPLSEVGPVAAIRLSRSIPLTLDQLFASQALSSDMGRFLGAAIKCGLNILISGGAATGKTTMLNILAGFIPPEERVVTIEETRELSFNHPHTVSLETRLPNTEGIGEVNLTVLVRNALRMRADRIIVGEVRGAEVFDMLQAMNVGHSGSLTTVHANNPQDALRRLETLVLMSGVDLPSRAIREMLGVSFDLVVHITRFRDGTRKVTDISEVVTENENAETRPLFSLEPQGRKSANEKKATFKVVGSSPVFWDKMTEEDPGLVGLFT